MQSLVRNEDMLLKKNHKLKVIVVNQESVIIPNSLRLKIPEANNLNDVQLC